MKNPSKQPCFSHFHSRSMQILNNLHVPDVFNAHVHKSTEKLLYVSLEPREKTSQSETHRSR